MESLVVVGAASWKHDQARADYEELRAGFCFRPGENLIGFLQAQGHTQVLRWLDPATNEAEPKALMGLMVELMRQNMNIWDQKGITLFLDGRWSRGARARRPVRPWAGSAIFLRMPIVLFFKERQEGDECQKLTITPNEPTK